MLDTAGQTFARSCIHPHGQAVPSLRSARHGVEGNSELHVAEVLKLVSEALAPTRRLVHAGEPIYQASERFGNLHILNTGFIKIVGLAGDGRQQGVGLKFRGDWLGFDGIATGQYSCDAVAMDTGEVWTFRYQALLAACPANPELLPVLHQAMSREITHDRDALMSICSMPAELRVAEFLHSLAESLATCGLRSDQITLRMTRAEIGNYLGMRLETVSRVLSKLARAKLIGFNEKGRREVHIPDLGALSTFIQEFDVPSLALQ